MTYLFEGRRTPELIDNQLGLRRNDFLCVQRTVIHNIRKYGDMSFGPIVIQSIVSLAPPEIEMARKIKQEQLDQIHGVVDNHHLTFATLDAFVLNAGLEPLLFDANRLEINPPSGTVAARMRMSSGSLDALNALANFEIFPDTSLGEFVLARPNFLSGNRTAKGWAYVDEPGSRMKGIERDLVCGFDIDYSRNEFGERVVPQYSKKLLSPVKYITFVKI